LWLRGVAVEMPFTALLRQLKGEGETDARP
jgi:hypothetical protein